MMKRITVFFLLLLILLLSSCKKKPLSFSKSYFAFGVESSITFYGYDEKEFKEYFDYSRTYLSKMDKLTNRYQGYDDYLGIKYINENAGKEIVIDSSLFDLIEYSISNGNSILDENNEPYFNIAIGKVSDLYKDIFDNHNKETIDNAIYPSNDLINKKYEADLTKISLNKENHSITIPVGMSLDLGGIAKGYAMEHLRNYFDSKNLKYTIDSGDSTILTSFGNPYRNNNDYIIALRDPNDLGSSSYFALLTAPHNKAISTSGDYQKYFIYDNRIHSHILNYHTNESVITDIRSITVITDNLAYGDMMSTILYMMGSDKAIEYSKSHENIDIIIYKEDSTIYISENIKNNVRLDEKYK